MILRRLGTHIRRVDQATLRLISTPLHKGLLILTCLTSSRVEILRLWRLKVMLRIALNTISLQQLSLLIWFCIKTQLLKERLSKVLATIADPLHYWNKKISTTRKTFLMQFNQHMKSKGEKHLAMGPSASNLASSCKKDLIKMALRS